MAYELLEEFETLFDGLVYRHRSSQNGDRVAQRLYDDLFNLGRSLKLVARIKNEDCVVNTRNRVTGRYVRRGDGTFGEKLPHADTIHSPSSNVGRGPIANIEIAVETKILATAIGKQVQERISSLTDQAAVFRKGNPNAICVAVVGINYAKSYLAYEGTRTQLTDGLKYAHPAQQAANAEARVRNELAAVYDEVVVLPFEATNQPPLPFSWVNQTQTTNEYAASLVRVSREYEKRF